MELLNQMAKKHPEARTNNESKSCRIAYQLQTAVVIELDRQLTFSISYTLSFEEFSLSNARSTVLPEIVS